MRVLVIVLTLSLAVLAAAACGVLGREDSPPSPTASRAWSAQLCDDIVFAASFVETKLPAHTYCVNADGSGPRPLTGIRHPLDATNNWEIRPRWSPDGTRIAIVSPAQNGILIVQPNNVVVKVAASVEYDDEQWPVWSPDGTRLAYVDPQHGISVVNADGLFPRQVAPPHALHPSWSPDGAKIAYIRTIPRSDGPSTATPADAPADSDVMVVNADEGQPVRIIRRTATVGRLSAGSSGFGTPTWSPDGSMVAVHWEDVSSEETRITLLDAIVAVSADGEREYVYDENAAGPGVWSRDGRQFYYPGSGALDIHPGIYAVSADGTDKRRITSARHPEDLALSPDGATLAYTDQAGLFVLELSGPVRHRVATWEDGMLAGWSPDGGRLLFWIRTDAAWIVSDFFMDPIVELRIVDEDGTGLTTVAAGMFLDSWSSVIPPHAEWRPRTGP